jgi:hypothetical protein
VRLFVIELKAPWDEISKSRRLGSRGAKEPRRGEAVSQLTILIKKRGRDLRRCHLHHD